MNKLRKIWKEWIPYVAILLIVILIRSFLVTPVRVNGTSMVPTLLDNELLLLKKYDHSYKRFEIVVFNYRREYMENGKIVSKEERLVKRIVGFPGEHIEYKNNKLFINGKETAESFLAEPTEDFDLIELGYDTIPDDCYFVMGDNRNNSTDSRIIGCVKEENIIGKTNFVIFPFNHFGKVN